MIGKDQLPEKFRDIINRQVDKFKVRVFTDEVDEIPSVDDIPGESSAKWLKIKDVVCVYVDMKNSTKLSASHHAGTTARSYTLFTGTAIRLFKEFGASYIDIRGDGVFALFNSNKVHAAFASAVTFKTFIQSEFTTRVTNKTSVDTGVHIGIHQATLIVSKIGLRKSASRGDMHNEVWAGKAVNMASKLASLSDNDEIYVSDKYYSNLSSHKALYSCDCNEPVLLWNEVDLTHDDKFSFNTARVLESVWCKQHGAEYLNDILAAD
ncbi:adenylate/guanylate cyclase domain-containing protein [Pseudoalteromonas distincta]|uniref:adenylate/guanylate cyclase domain-containing protein n=1 Tax=Pseudoalteromonas distincta TaxID=77608 RepID=UPI0039E960C0